MTRCHLVDQPLQVEPVGDEPPSQLVEQWRIRRRIARSNVVHRIDDARPVQVTPITIHDALGKIRVLRRSQPAGQAGPWIRVLVVQFTRKRERSRNRLARLRMLDVDPLRQRVNDLLATHRTRLATDRREIGRQLVVLPLSPSLEGMVVTLVALEASPDEDLRHVLHHHFRLARNPVIVRRRILVRAATGRHQLVDKLVERHVRRQRTSDPVPKRPRSLLGDELAVGQQQVRPFQCPMLDELRAVDQLLDPLGSLLHRRTRVSKEGLDLLDVWRQPGEID